MKLKFFTDKTVENDYLLIKIQDYMKNNVDWTKWKEIFIDPGVYELTKQPYYSWEKFLNIMDFLNSLPKNHYFSADYPCDMNLNYTDYFLQKSWENAIQYCWHSNYITTVQFKFNDYWSFREWFDRYNELNLGSGIMGLGNFCRILGLTEFIKHSLGYAFSHCKHPRIHIYGLSIRIIPFAYNLAKKFNIELSVDSTKWTRACTLELKQKHNINCTNDNRQLYFNEYLKLLKKKKVWIQNDYVDGD